MTLSPLDLASFAACRQNRIEELPLRRGQLKIMVGRDAFLHNDLAEPTVACAGPHVIQTPRVVRNRTERGRLPWLQRGITTLHNDPTGTAFWHLRSGRRLHLDQLIKEVWAGEYPPADNRTPHTPLRHPNGAETEPLPVEQANGLYWGANLNNDRADHTRRAESHPSTMTDSVMPVPGTDSALPDSAFLGGFTP